MDVNSRDPSQNIIPFRITGIEAARFDQNGNLGIGTTTPSTKLDVSGNVNISGSTTVNNDITIAGKLILSTNSQTSGLNNINPAITINGRVIEDKITAVVNMDSQVSTTALNKQKKQSIPLAEPSILRTNDIVAKMSGVSVGKTQVYGVGTGQTASYGNIVVAVGAGTNSIAYSLANPPTASSWVGIPNGSSTFSTGAFGIAYANGTWVAVGEGTNAIAYSTMTPPIASSWVGIPWNVSKFNGTINTFASGGTGRSIIYANGYWVVSGNGANCLCYSNANPPTAESWIGVPLSGNIINNAATSIAYGNGTWVIVGNTTNALAYSTRTPPTADSWTVIPVGATNDSGSGNMINVIAWSVTYVNGVWLIGGESNFNIPLMYSVENPPISTSWMPVFSSSTTPLYNFGTLGRSVAYGNGVWVACGTSSNLFAYSTSPIPYASSWIHMKGPAGVTSKTIYSITFNSSTNTWFFCGGWSNQCLFYSTQTPPVPASWIAVSMGPNTFTTDSRAVAAITTPAFTSPVNVARLDNKVTFPVNRLIAVGGGGGDSGTLNSGSGSIGGAIIGNRSGSSLNSNTIVYSDDDGNTWQMVPGGATNAMFSSADDISANVSMGVGGSGGANAVAWNGERWVAAGNGRTHSLAFSDDGGMTWTGITGKSIFSVEARSVAWNGNMWVAVGRGNSFSTAYSYDGITWMGSVGPSGNAVNVFSYEGPVDNSGNALAANISDLSGGGNQVIWNGKYWIATGTRTQDTATNSSYTIAISQDGKTWRKISGGTNGYNSGSASATNGFDIYAYGIEWNGRNFVATGRGTVNTLAYSTDGVSWFGLGNTIFSNWGRGITWGSRKWVATGSGTNTVAYSSNGRNWMGCGANVFKPLRRFMAMGDTPAYTNVNTGQPQRGVAFTYSDDGVNWDTPVVNQGVEINVDSAAALYPFTTHRFTNAGATGRTGPALSTIKTAYSSASWAQNSNYLTMTSDNGIQLWTVPATGIYIINIAGAAGASHNLNSSSMSGVGLGWQFTTVVKLVIGEVYAIVVGQRATPTTSGNEANGGGAGGGGSFIWNNSSKVLLAAAGGGGGRAIENVAGSNTLSETYGINGLTGTTASLFNYDTGKTTYNSYYRANNGQSGGNWTSASSSGYTITGGKGWTEMINATDFTGRAANDHGSSPGFGGGSTTANHGGGGGGGYSGGGSLNYIIFTDLHRSGGGGGSSYSVSPMTNTGTNSNENGFIQINIIIALEKPPSTLYTNQMLLTNTITDNSVQHSALMYSADGGSSWSRVPGSSDASNNSGTDMTVANGGCFSVAMNTNRTRFLATGGDIASATQKVSLSSDGFNWSRTISSPNSTKFAWVWASLWVGGGYNRWLIGGNDVSNNNNGRIMYSGDSDISNAWVDASPATYTGIIVTCFAANPTFTTILAGTTMNTILRSTNGGATWTTIDISGTPISAVNSIAFSPTANSGNGRWVAVGGGSGAVNTIIYSTDSTGNTWTVGNSKIATNAIFKTGECVRVLWDGVNSRFIAGGYNAPDISTLSNSYTVSNTIINSFPANINALNFDGTDDFIDISGGATDLNKANFTIECWIKTNNSGINSGMGLVNCQNANTSWETGEKSFYIDVSGTPRFVGNCNDYILSVNTAIVNDGAWHHIAVVWAYSGSGTAGRGYIYVDGLDRTDTTNVVPYVANNDNVGTFVVGRPNYWASEAPNFFNGSMFELRIWNVARTAAQIQSAYNAQLVGNETGLVGYWRMNQGVAGAVNSSSTIVANSKIVGGSTGTLTNFGLSGPTSNWVYVDLVSNNLGYSIAYSDANGVNWFPVSNNNGPFLTQCRDIVALDTNGEYTPKNTGYSVTWNSYANRFIATGNGTTPVVVSNDGGVTWSSAAQQVPQQAIAVVCGKTASSATSTTNVSPIAYTIDGITWQQSIGAKEIFIGASGGGNVNCAKYGQTSTAISPNGRIWVAGGVADASYSLAMSQNGIRWTGIVGSKGIIGEVRTIAYAPSADVSGASTTSNNGMGNGVWVAGGFGMNSLAFSYDGLNWSEVPNSTTILGRCNACTYGNGLFVAGGTGATFLATAPTDLGAYNDASYQNMVYSMSLTGSTSGTIIGSDIYRRDSPLATAAVHAGVLANGETRIVYLQMLYNTNFPAITRNGITSSSVSSMSLSFRFLPSTSPLCSSLFAYSRDGLNWTNIPYTASILNGTIQCITYGKDERGRGLWVAGAATRTSPNTNISILYSYNGIDWTTIVGSGSLSTSVNSIAYGINSTTGRGMWIAAVNNTTNYSFLQSSTGRGDWTPIPNTKTGLFNNTSFGATGISYLNGVWYATGVCTAITAGRSVAYSYDGVSWFGVYQFSNMYGVTNPVQTFDISMSGVATVNDLVMPAILTPVRASAWTAGVGSAYLQHPTIAFGAEKTIVSASGPAASASTSYKNITAMSPDGGRTWAATTTNSQYFISGADIGNTAFRGGVCNDAVWNGTIWVAVGLAANGSKVATSKDGVNWTQIPATNVPIDGVINAIMWNGDKWIIGGDGSTTPQTSATATTFSIAASTDAINWTGIALSDTNVSNVKRIAWNGMYWLAVGNGTVSTMMGSTDGVNWFDTISAATLNGSSTIIESVNDIVWGGNRWIAVGNPLKNDPNNNFAILYSTDTAATTGPTAQLADYAYTGRKWVGVPGSSNLFPYGVKSVSWNGKRFIATGPAYSSLSTGNIIAWSADGIKWTAFSSAKTVAPGQRWIAVGSGSRSTIATSTDGKIWSESYGTSALFPDISGMPLQSSSGVAIATGARAIGWNGNSLIVGGSSGISDRSTVPIYAFIGSGINNPMYIEPGANNIAFTVVSSVFVSYMDVSQNWLNTYTDMSMTNLFQVTQEPQQLSSALKWNGYAWVAHFGMTSYDPSGIQYGNIWYTTDPLARVGWSVASNYSTPRILTGQGGYAGLEWNGTAWLACGFDTNNNNIIYTTDKYGATGWTAVSSFVGSSSFQPVCIASSNKYWVVGGRNATSPAIYFTTDKLGATGWNMVVNSVLPGSRITSIGFNGVSWLCCGGSSISYKLDLSGTADIRTGWVAASGNFPQVMDSCSAISYNATNASWVVVGDASSNYSNIVSYTTAIDGSAGWVRGLGTLNSTYGKFNGVLWTGTAWLASCGAGSSLIGCTSTANGANNWNGAVSNTQLNNSLRSPSFCTNAVTSANIPISLLTTGMISNSGVGAGVGALWRSSAGRGQGVFGNETSSVIVRSTNGADATMWSPTFSKNFLIAVGGSAIRDATNNGGMNRMSYSYNGGVTWIPNNPLALTGYGRHTVGNIRTVKYSNGIWVAGGDINTTTGHCLAYSRDGVNWIGAGGTQIFGTGGSCYAVCGNDRGRWVAVGGSPLATAGTYTNTSGSIYTMAWSDDGINWTPILGSRALFGIVCQGVSYGADASGVGMWTAIGRGGINAGAGLGYTGIAYSYDAKNWFLTQTSASLFGTGANVLTERYAPVTSMPTNTDLGCRSIAMSGTGQYQTVVVYQGSIYRSTDYGVTWNISDTAAPALNWVAVAISSSGQYQIAGASGDQIYVSNNFGETWTRRASSRTWRSVAISGTGKYQVGVSTAVSISISRDFGITWNDIADPIVIANTYTAVAISSSGQYITAVGNGVRPVVSNDYGISFAKYAADWNWATFAMSATGQYQIGSNHSNFMHVSTNYGVDWAQDGPQNASRHRCVAISATGQYRVGVREESNVIQISRNYGSSYQSVGPIATWTAVAISSTGQYVSAITNTSTAIYISSNYGVTWSASATDSRSLSIMYGKDASGVGLWVATAGRRDRDFAATSTNTMAYSYDGKFWRGILASACMSHQAWSVAYGKDGYGAGMWVAGGYDVACGLKWSYDGITWNAALGSGAHGWASMASGRRVTSVYWNGSVWYASTSATSNGEVSDGFTTATGLVGYLLYSYNGKNWMPVLSNTTTAFNNVNTRTTYSTLPNSCILDFGSFYDDQSQRGTTITNTASAGMIGPVYSGVPPKNVNTIVPIGCASRITGQVPFLMGGDSGLVDVSAGSGGSAGSISGIPPITSEIAATTTSLAVSLDGGNIWRAVPNSARVMTRVNKIMCDENTQQIVAVGTGNFSVATSTPATCDATNGWVGVFGSRMTNTKTGLFDTYGTGAAWFSGAKMWIAGGRARTKRGSSLAVSVNGTVWQDAKIVSRTTAGAGTVATAGKGGGLLSRPMTSSSTFSTSDNTMLYPFAEFSFTTGGQTGQQGPSLSTLQSAYSSDSRWKDISPYFNMTTNGIQEWTVPVTGIYIITALGAAGGNAGTYCRGINITTSALLTKGEVIYILVGQQGGWYSAAGWTQGYGGGGTFVVRGSIGAPRAIIVAGGGGGRGSSLGQEFTRSNATTSTTGQTGGGDGLTSNGTGGTGNSIGTSGNGGNPSSEFSAGGGGLTGNGVNSQSIGSSGGISFTNGGVGGAGSNNITKGGGGFGGGGGGTSNYGGAGGGGYSGGGGGYSPVWASGGGGGSYAINAMIFNGYNNGPGRCDIVLVRGSTTPALSIFSTSTLFTSSVIPYTASSTPLLTYTDSASAFSTQVSSVATNSQYNRAVVGGSSVQFVAGGRSGAAGAGGGDISNNLAYSYDGVNWTPVSYSSGLAGSGSGSIFQTPTNVATYTGSNCGLDASFGTTALTPRYTNTNPLFTTSIKQWTSVAISKTGQYQVASVYNEYIYTSSDYGQNWIQITATGAAAWRCVAISYSGQYQMAILGDTAFVWISNNYGVSWTQTQTGNNGLVGCAISGTGQYQAVVNYSTGSFISISSDYGINWRRAGNSPNQYWASISISETGQYMIGMTYTQHNQIWRSCDYGNSWSVILTGAAEIGSNSASFSSNGQYQTVALLQFSGLSPGYIFISSDYGVTWSQIYYLNQTYIPNSGQKSWCGVSISANGKFQTAIASGPERIYRSEDYGNNWFEPLIHPGTKKWTGISVSYSGQYQTAVAQSNTTGSEGEYIYTSSDYGNTWIRQQPESNKFIQVSSSATGQYQIATSNSIDNNNMFYISTDYGNSWVNRHNIGSWTSCTISGTGQYAASLHSSNVIDQAPIFDGTTNCFIDIGVPAIFTRTQIRSTMTLECWFKTADLLAQKTTANLVSRNNTQNSPSTSVFSLSMTSSGSIFFNITTDVNTYFSVTTTQTYNDANWHHVAATYNSTGGVMNLYIDGVIVLSTSDPTKGILSSSTTLRLVIGCDDAGLTTPSSGGQQSDRQFRGSISDVRIWNVVRSPGDIQNNYKRRLIGNETGLIGYWKLNQSNYTHATNGWLDSSIYKNNSATAGSTVVFNTSSPITINELNNNYISYSSDYGNTWTVATNTSLPNPFSSWKSISMTYSGQNQTAVVYGGSIYRSSNAGITWNSSANVDFVEISSTSLSNTQSPTFAWKAITVSATSQYQSGVATSGQIYVNSDYGRNAWTAVDASRNWTSLTMSSDGRYQSAVVSSDKIYYNSNFGIGTWTAATTVPSTLTWTGISMSADGKYQTAVSSGSSSIYVNSTFGAGTWTTRDSQRNWWAIAVSSTGQYQTALMRAGNIYIDSSFGTTASWTPVASTQNWQSVAMSGSGQYQTAVVSNGQIFSNNNYGANASWTAVDSSRNWISVSVSSATGQYQTAVVQNGFIYINSNYGAGTWTQVDSSRNWVSVAVSSIGKYQTAAVNSGQVYFSRDYGMTWSTTAGLDYFGNNWQDVAVSAETGAYQIACVNNGYLYVSNNSNPVGSNWVSSSIVIDGSGTQLLKRGWQAVANSATGQYALACEGSTTTTTITNATISPSRFWKSVSISSTGQYQTAGVGEGGVGQIFTSYDYGFTWQTRDTTRHWYGVSISATGQYQTAVVEWGVVYTSDDYGVNWTPRNDSVTRNWWCVSISSSGQYQTAAGGTSTTLWTSWDYGVTWTARSISANWYSVAVSSTGQYQVACVIDGNIYTSSDYGAIWTSRGNRAHSVAISSTGQYQTATGRVTQNIYISSNFGINWIIPTNAPTKSWMASNGVSMSASGQYQTVVDDSGQIYVSSDYGYNWSASDSNRNWYAVSVSSTGQYQTAVVQNGNIYFSRNYGQTWSTYASYDNVVSNSGKLYRSVNYGAAWDSSGVIIDGSGSQLINRPWQCVGMSSSGKYQVACSSSSSSPLYTFTSHTFTNASATGRVGPNLSAVRTAYSSATWASTYVNMTSDNGIQLWTVPATGQYTISCSGSAASGGGGGYVGGRGRTVTGQFTLIKGDVLKILVGQAGNTAGTFFPPSNYTYATSGGGGSFVTLSDNTILLIGGGGGGSMLNNGIGRNGGDAPASQLGSGGGGASGDSGGGGGYQGSASGQMGGISFLGGGAGGLGSGAGVDGGFGGGGGSFLNTVGYSGGGGGYSGGGAGSAGSASAGGESFLGTAKSAILTSYGDYNNGPGTVTITANQPVTFNPGYIYYSLNYGASWTTHPTAGSRAWSSVALSANGSTISATTSDASGAIWTYSMPDDQYSRPPAIMNTTGGGNTTPATVRAVAYGNSGTGAATDGYWVAGADASANTLAYSSNGIDWTAVVGSKTTLFNSVNGVAYGADLSGTMLWVAVGTPFIGSVYGSSAYSIAYSYNMTTWIGVLNTGNFTGQGNRVTYGQDENGVGMWVAVGQGDGVSPSNDICGNQLVGAPNSTIYYSYDGVSWNAAQGTGVFTRAGNDVSWGVDASGVATWVATGVGSTNAITGAYVAGGQIAYSVNGRVWTAANTTTSPPFSTAGLSVAYGNAGTNGTGVAQWIVGGSGGSVFWYSPRPSAGIWTSMAAASAYAPFPVCNSIGYSNGIWVASNNTNSTNAIARSTDGGATWTGVPLSTTASFTGGCADVAANSYCNFSLAYADYSTDTNLRSWVAIPGTKNLMFEGGVNSVATVSSNINAITYNNNRSWWVAGGVGTSNSTVVAALAYTTDPSGAIGWTKSASSDIANLASINDIAFSPQTQRWLAVGNGSTATPTRTALYSDASGVTWTSAIVAASDPSMNMNTCIWNQLDASASSAGRWLAGGTSSGTGNSAASLFVSTDVSGANWSAVAGTGAILSQVYSIAYNGGVWIAAGVPNSSVIDASKCCLMRTFDISGASNWQPIPGTKTNGASANNGDGGFDTSARSITWNSDQKMWIATGENAGIADASFSSVMYSLDISGAPGTWRSVRESNSLFSVQGNGITFTGKKWVAAGEGTNTIVASSGTLANEQGSWSKITAGSNAMPIRATDIAYTGTSIIATGQIANGGPGTSGAIVSTDASGTSWSPANIGFIDSSGGATSIVYEPSYDGGLLVATGKGAANAISYSTDYGATWVNATTRDASGASSTNTQQLFTTGGNGVEYIGNDTLFAGGGNDVHWNGKRWVALGKTSERPAGGAATATTTTTEVVVTNNNSSSIATSDDGITWSSVPSNQTSEMTEGTFIATNSRIGATPLINSQIVIMDGGDTELTGDFGSSAAMSSANGMGVGIAQIDIIGENQIIPSAAGAISNANQIDLLGVAITANGAGMTPIPSFDNTAFTITVRPLP